MTKNKIRIGVLFGGKSAEHEVSLLSAKNVIEALDREKYEIVLLGIDKKGVWHISDNENFLLNPGQADKISLNELGAPSALIPGKEKAPLVRLTENLPFEPLDVVFPVLHGTFGEDGTVQGLLKLAGVPFVGAGVLGSAVGMDKDVMKRLLRDAGIPIAKYILHRSHEKDLSPTLVEERVGFPCFVKPANLGSSVGIHKVDSPNDLGPALKDAFKYDEKVIIEEAFENAREIECAVLGNEFPEASLPGEVIPQNHAFYSYEAKYLDDDGALLMAPAELPKKTIEEVQTLAKQVFRVLDCAGMARVDVFLTKDGKLVVNEINTIPGFTKISMYPKLWTVSGLPYGQLLDRLIDLALERHKRESQLQTHRI